MLKRNKGICYITNFITLLEQVQAKENDFELALNQLRYINSQR